MGIVRAIFNFCNCAVVLCRVATPRSSSGLGRRTLTPVTRVQIPYGVPPLPLSLRIVRALGGFALSSGCVGGALGGVSGGVGVMQSELNRYSNIVVLF